MKKLISAFVVIGTVALIACNKKDGGESQTVAATPQVCNNSVPGQPNCQYYQNYYGQQQITNWSYGSWYWPTQYTPTYGTCGCQAGYFPVNGPFGTACAPNTYSQTFGVVGYGYPGYGYSGGGFGYWNQGQNTGWLNRPQVVYNGSAACSQSTAQGCDVRMNNCPAGARCQAVAGGSTIGLCVR